LILQTFLNNFCKKLWKFKSWQREEISLTFSHKITFKTYRIYCETFFWMNCCLNESLWEIHNLSWIKGISKSTWSSHWGRGHCFWWRFSSSHVETWFRWRFQSNLWPAGSLWNKKKKMDFALIFNIIVRFSMHLMKVVS